MNKWRSAWRRTLRHAVGVLLLRLALRIRVRAQRLLADPEELKRARFRPGEFQWLIDACKNAAALYAIAQVAASDAPGAAFHRSALVKRARKIIETIEDARRAEAGAAVSAGDGKVLALFGKKQ